MKVYIQKDGKEYSDDWLFAAYLGCEGLGWDVINFTEEEVKENEIPNNQFIIADISTTLTYLKNNGIEIPKPLNIPDEIRHFAKRDFGTTTLRELIEHPENFKFPIFVKPNDNLKSIPAGVISKPELMRCVFSDVTKKWDETILTSTVVNMVSEYRCFVNDGRFVGIQHYLGDFTLFPDVHIIERMIKEYKSAPICYTLDVAVTDKYDTVLIECNDAWSIGHYGLDARVYVRMLHDRWKQMLKTKAKKENYEHIRLGAPERIETGGR